MGTPSTCTVRGQHAWLWPERHHGKLTSDGLHTATREPRSGGREGGAHQRSHFYGGVRVDREDASVRGRRSGRGSRISGRGGAPWWHRTCGGVREQPQEATIGRVLTEEDDDGGTLVAWLR
jgi:hypothetical protein